MASSKTLSIAKDYSPYVAGRYETDGEFNGEKFRKKYLIEALKHYDQVILDVDGLAGFPSSFWEEVTGGLIRDGFSADEVNKKLYIKTTNKSFEPYVALAYKYIEEEQNRKK